MKNVVIIGAGKIGRMAAHLLARSGEYQVHVVDAHEQSWRDSIAGLAGATGATVDFAKQSDLDANLQGRWALISCAPFFCNPLIAERAKAHGVHSRGMRPQHLFRNAGSRLDTSRLRPITWQNR